MPGLEQELRTAYRTGKLELGTKSTIRNLKLGRAKMVIIASNADPSVKEDINRYASLSGIPVVEFNGTSIELGTVLGKPFPIQALAVLDAGDSNLLDFAEESG